MSLRLRNVNRALRVRFGATKPLPKPPGKYHLEPTEEEQMRELEAARMRGRRAGIAAERALFGKAK
jgi:hypothetical protein